MLRSELIEILQERLQGEPDLNVEDMVDAVLEEIIAALEAGDRVEIRGFGAFSVRERAAREGRNPRTGVSVSVSAKRVPFFRPGKELRERVDEGCSAKPRRGDTNAKKKSA
jgi:integration host factor subunit beta